MEVFNKISRKELSDLEFKAYFHDWPIYGDNNNTRYLLKPLKEEKSYLVCCIYNLEQAMDSPFMYPLLKAEGFVLEY